MRLKNQKEKWLVRRSDDNLYLYVTKHRPMLNHDWNRKHAKLIIVEYRENKIVGEHELTVSERKIYNVNLSPEQLYIAVIERYSDDRKNGESYNSVSEKNIHKFFQRMYYSKAKQILFGSDQEKADAVNFFKAEIEEPTFFSGSGLAEKVLNKLLNMSDEEKNNFLLSEKMLDEEPKESEEECSKN